MAPLRWFRRLFRRRLPSVPQLPGVTTIMWAEVRDGQLVAFHRERPEGVEAS